MNEQRYQTAAWLVFAKMGIQLGFFVIAILLLPFLFLAGVGSDVLLALTFLRSRETEQVEFV